MKKITLTTIVASLFFLSCMGQQTSENLDIDLTGTIWEYSDEDWTYQIEFLENGKIMTTHPNETTPDNDEWKQTENKVELEFNNGYSKYTGDIISEDLIEGTAVNKRAEWEWKMVRIK